MLGPSGKLGVPGFLMVGKLGPVEILEAAENGGVPLDDLSIYNVLHLFFKNLKN
jgi:hypothetical protein